MNIKKTYRLSILFCLFQLFSADSLLALLDTYTLTPVKQQRLDEGFLWGAATTSCTAASILGTAIGSAGMAVAGIGGCLGLGIGGIVKIRRKKQKIKEYIQTFKDMGYSDAQAKIYADMSLNNPAGLQAVLKDIEQQKTIETQKAMQKEQIAAQQEIVEKLNRVTAQQEIIEKLNRTTDQQNTTKNLNFKNNQDKKDTHIQQLEQMVYEYKLQLFTYLFYLLSTIILLGFGWLLYKKR